MSKGIELTQSQIKAYESGATIFLFPIEKKELCRCAKFKEEFIKNYSPIQKGDKDIFVQENFKVTNHHQDHFIYENEMSQYFNKQNIFKDASQMTREQARYSFSECIDIKIIRPKEIACKEYFNKEELREISLIWVGNFNQEAYKQIGCQLFIDMYNQQMQERNINRTYNDNDYMFLVEFKR